MLSEALSDTLADLGLEDIAEADLCLILQEHIISAEGAGSLARDAGSLQEWVKARGCPFPNPSWQQRVSFLVCELQLCRIRANRASTGGAQPERKRPHESEPHPHDDHARAAHELCEDGLGLDTSTGSRHTFEQHLAAAETAIDRMLAPSSASGGRVRHDDVPARRVVATLCDAQLAHLEQVNSALRRDFTVRRQMLLKRCDVTIQSFLWGNKTQGQEGTIIGAIESKRELMLDEPAPIAVDSVLTITGAEFDALLQRLTQHKNHRSAMKAVVIGSVPDRGGDAKKQRPRASDIMPKWGPMSALPSTTGGRGGGGGGGGCGGGGGGGGCGGESGGRGGESGGRRGRSRGGRGGSGR